jgi:hypothetical protein
MNIKTTVICHFFNEEVYLPIWLRHHTKLFDHGIMIDYHSTDRSREIIRQIAPTWDIVSTKNEMFETVAIDREVMEIERGVEGWKTALNATEFLVTHDLKGVIEQFLQTHPSQHGFVTRGCLIIESPDQKDKSATLEDKIWEQFHFGIAQNTLEDTQPVLIQRARLVHRSSDGRYGPGRHTNGISQIIWPLHLFWYGWCPLSLKKVRNRITRPKIPQENLGLGWGTHHVFDDCQIDATWRSYVPFCYDLLGGQHPELNAAVEKLRTVA